jgi:hypothetical protein
MPPSTDVRSNIMSLAMVEAASQSAETGDRVAIADVLDDAYAHALADEHRADVAAVLRSWGSAHAGLAAS